MSYIDIFSNSEDLSEQFKGINILNPEKVKETVNEILPFGVEYLADDLAIVSLNDLEVSIWGT